MRRLVIVAVVALTWCVCGTAGAQPRTFNVNYTSRAQVPQLLVLKVSNDIHLEADLVLVLAP